MRACRTGQYTVYPKKYAHGFVVLCFAVVMQSFIMNSHEVFIHIRQGCFAGTGAIVRLPQCQWSKPDGYGKISKCLTTTKHSKAKTVCIFLGIYCIADSFDGSISTIRGLENSIGKLIDGKDCQVVVVQRRLVKRIRFRSQAPVTGPRSLLHTLGIQFPNEMSWEGSMVRQCTAVLL